VKELRQLLARVEIPGEETAQERSWEVVCAAFAGREPVPAPRRSLRPVLVFAALVALVAAALTPPGRAVIDTLRERIAGVEQAQPALFALPAPGRLLVDSPAGAWVVRADGSKRLLADIGDPSWSPHGQFVVGLRGRELVALEPGGRTRWSLARPEPGSPRWGGTRTDTRIAYLSGRTLRVVAGDGTGDRRLAAGVARVAPAWRPGGEHVVAYATGSEVVAVAADTGRQLWRRPTAAPRALEWSADGELLLVRGTRTLRLLGRDGSLRFELLRPPAAPVTAAHVSPDGSAVAFVQQTEGRSDLWVVPELRPDASAARRVFSGAGAFTGLAWSPDGRWLLLAWADADQWVFVRSARVRGLDAVSDVSRQFGGAFPRLAGWCCPPEREATVAEAAAAVEPEPVRAAAAVPAPAVEWRRSRPLGLPHAGRLVNGVELPREGPTFFTWDPVRRTSPNPRWRRYGADRVVRIVLRILEEHAAAHTGAPRIGVGDLSRPRGGHFGPKHVSHQNGLDVDIYFPRLDRKERPPDRPQQIDRRLAQDLVDRFVAAGAVRVFVGPRTGLTGPPGVVQVLPNHDNHLHARFPDA
jgi:hypothetical protein